MKQLNGVIASGDGLTFPGQISFGERIERIETASGGDDYLLPGFIDLQVNGSHGIDVMTAAPEELAMLGGHLEPRGEPLECVLGLKRLRLVTLAPELPGAPEAIRRLCAREVVVSIGHTDATLAEAEIGIAAGARMFTHLFNAMRPLGHRDPGVITAALLPSAAMPAVIPDGVHVDPAVLKLVYQARGATGMILTSDRVALGGEAGTASGPVGRAPARVKDGAARLADGTLAGSVISMLDGARLMAARVGASIGAIAMMSAANPAALLGVQDRGRLKIGMCADLLLLSRDLKLKAVFIGGREIS
jgi:N-acetylglucosamine-6-phosphate deacetylase